jgi:hypothetical protein
MIEAVVAIERKVNVTVALACAFTFVFVHPHHELSCAARPVAISFTHNSVLGWVSTSIGPPKLQCPPRKAQQGHVGALSNVCTQKSSLPIIHFCFFPAVFERVIRHHRHIRFTQFTRLGRIFMLHTGTQNLSYFYILYFFGAYLYAPRYQLAWCL